MALFSRTQKDEDQKGVVSAPATISTASTSHVLKSPRITEKASMHAGSGVYVFDVAENASKREILQAVFALYKVHPRKVAIVTIPAKVRRSMRTGKRGVKQGGKKAYVYLKNGETINIS